ncbi:MAG TPA: DUF4268 domain-containing protein [Gammaproteobacteria bacterium]|nr:DUF4268 domain-containing protein [Gammaproteobacteria bacterium]
MQKLARLEVVDLREVWKTEAADFTPWLAQEGNIALLGETIGIDLEVEAQEKNVGPFRADILCKNTLTDDWVLIENQLERTDHVHLGQLLTYAAGLNAVTIVWIADQFTEEHRAALDWLNEITDNSVNFFGLEVELWRIQGSPIAPKFNIVCKPNDWVKNIGRAATQMSQEDLSDTRKMQLDYWKAFRDYVAEHSSTLRPQKPAPQHWTNFAIGRSHFHISALLNTWEKKIGVALQLTGGDAKAHFHLLYRDKEAIEEELGETLEWRENPDKKESGIWLRTDRDPADVKDWPAQHEWLLEKLEKFHSVFAARVKSLDASQYVLSAEE